MSLCFFEGEEYGMGNLLGKNPRKCPLCGDFGLNLKTLLVVVLEP